MAYFNALLQHQGPLKHVNHRHRVVATGSNILRETAETDAVAFHNAAKNFFEYSGSPWPFKNWPRIQQAMDAILRRAGDQDYLKHLRNKGDYRYGLSYLVSFILAQKSEEAWYDLQKEAVRFMYSTAESADLWDVNDAGNFESPGPYLTSMLNRFWNFALERNDNDAADTASMLRARMG